MKFFRNFNQPPVAAFVHGGVMYWQDTIQYTFSTSRLISFLSCCRVCKFYSSFNALLLVSSFKFTSTLVGFLSSRRVFEYSRYTLNIGTCFDLWVAYLHFDFEFPFLLYQQFCYPSSLILPCCEAGSFLLELSYFLG